MNTEKNRILLLGGSHSELPLITAAKSLGCEVVTSGNQADHPCHDLADLYLPGDFSDIDQMQAVYERSGCDYVVAAANDYAYLTACQLAEDRGLPGFDPYETAVTLHHKHLFKKLALSLGMPVTSFKVLKNSSIVGNALGLTYPIVVKPVDLTGGKGITIVDKPNQLPSALKYAASISKKEELIVEEFFNGTLHSYSIIIRDGKIIFEYTDNEFCKPNPFLVSTSTSISNVPTNIIADLRHQTEKIIRHLNLCDGVLHAQFLYREQDYRILEYTRRCSGDLYSDVVEHVTGLRHANIFIHQSLGQSIELRWNNECHPFISRHCIFAENPGKINSVLINKDLRPYVKTIVMAWPKDHLYKKPNAEKAAVIIIKYPTLEMMNEFTPKLHNLIHVE